MKNRRLLAVMAFLTAAAFAFAAAYLVMWSLLT